MGRAFFTRNPLLPREYFVPKGVDEFVAKMNQGVEHSLLDCPGRYTVQVATFRGKTVLQTDRNASRTDDERLRLEMGQDKTEDPLVEAAENAHLLTKELRKHGWEAYEFHDRTESIVTIGSFDQVGQQLANGQLVPIGPVQKIVQTFGAAYDTPADPLTRRRPADAAARRRHEAAIQPDAGQPQRPDRHGLNPKHVKIMHGQKVERIIPIDVYPHTIDVPRRSVSGAYAERN